MAHEKRAMNENTDPRPYWHIDLKWIFGILTTISLLLSLLLFILSHLTSEETFIPLATTIVANQFSRNGLDDPKDINEAKKKYLSTAENEFYPLGDKNVKITRKELETLGPREIRLRIFGQVVKRYYDLGIDGVANQTTSDPKQREEIKKQAGLLGLMNKKTHETIQTIFLISLLPLAGLIIGLVFYSYRYGRLVSPAIVLLLVSTFPTVLFFLIQNTPRRNGQEGPLPPFIPQDVAQELITIVSPVYYTLFLSGVGLIGLAVLIKIIKRFTKKEHN